MPPPPAKLVLFDVDGTLVASGHIGSRALERLFAEELGIPDAVEGYFFDGKTDPLIFRELLDRFGLALGRDGLTLERLYAHYVTRLEEERARATSGRVLDGVAELLDALAGDERFAVGLLTGNIRAGARIKLERFALWDRFAFGAFGDDAETRAELVPVALERALTHTRVAFPPAETWIVGDAVRDVACARANGARAIAVATGNTPHAELAGVAPDRLFRDLSDTVAVLGAFDGGT